jgi:hypothetical protein
LKIIALSPSGDKQCLKYVSPVLPPIEAVLLGLFQLALPMIGILAGRPGVPPHNRRRQPLAV